MNHATEASKFIADLPRAHWHDESLWFVRVKRDRAANSLPEWETLRETAAAIKTKMVANLPDYLEEFERNATKLGAVVHWANNAAEHNEIVWSLLKARGVKKLVKSKSMLTEECHLNPFLERHGVEVIDTDLGERIVQLINEPPSHIVMPCIHKKKKEIGDIFHEHLGTKAGADDPQYLAEAARQHLREKFMQAEAGLTGVNFAIAETGGFVVCTNEGNADLGVSLPPIHIASMGIEKLVPRAADLGVFLRLLTRSATGQPVTAYSAHFHGPRKGCELHIILVDNGRSAIRESEEFRRSLNCIRCGACMNTCPVYRRSGGHSYHTTVPGPIGSILAPARDAKEHYSLPHACTLCGSCSDVCPVKIDLHMQLLTWRREIAARGYLPWTKRMGMKVGGWLLSRPRLLNFVGGLARTFLPIMPRFLVYNPLNPWGKQRELPETPSTSFRDAYRKRATTGPTRSMTKQPAANGTTIGQPAGTTAQVGATGR